MKIDLVRGQNAFCWDGEGKEYIDLTSGGIFSAALGFSNPAVSRAAVGFFVKESLDCSYYDRFANRYRDAFIDDLRDFSGFEEAALFSAGTEATEAFWRVCRVVSGKPGIWGGLVNPDEVGGKAPRAEAFHGWALGSLVMAGRMTWRELGYDPSLGERRFGLSQEMTGGMIMEPYHAPSGQFHRVEPTIKRIRELQNTFSDIPLCLDEIQGGFGRAGKLWAHQHYVDESGELYLRPQFVTAGKALGGGFPISALLGPREVMRSEAVRKHAHLGSTHAGHPLMCAVGLAVLQEYRRLNLVDEAARKGKIMHAELATFPVRAHGKGLMAGLEFQDEPEASAVVRKCEERGLLVVDTHLQWVKLGPALTIEDETLLAGLKILREVVEEVYGGRETRGDSGKGNGSGGEVVQAAGVPAPGDPA